MKKTKLDKILDNPDGSYKLMDLIIKHNKLITKGKFNKMIKFKDIILTRI